MSHTRSHPERDGPSWVSCPELISRGVCDPSRPLYHVPQYTYVQNTPSAPCTLIHLCRIHPQYHATTSLCIVFTNCPPVHLFTSSTPMSHPLYQVSQYTKYILPYILNNPTHPAPHIPYALLPLSTTLHNTPLYTYHSGDSFLSLLSLDSHFLLLWLTSFPEVQIMAQLYTFKSRQISCNTLA